MQASSGRFDEIFMFSVFSPRYSFTRFAWFGLHAITDIDRHLSQELQHLNDINFTSVYSLGL